MKSLTPGIVLILFIILMSQMKNPAAAQDSQKITDGPSLEKPLPAELHGIWSWPDCTAGRRIVVFSSAYALFLRQGTSHLGALQAWRQEEDDGDMLYNYATNNNNRALMRKTNDGLMKIVFVAVHPKAPLKSGWGQLEQQTAQEYAHCAKLFDSNTGLGQDEIDTPFMLDEAFKACRTVTAANFTTAASCHVALFKIADTDKNKSLDHAELSRLYRQIAFAYASSVYCGGVAYPANSVREAADFATAALGLEKFITFDQAVKKLSDPQFLNGGGRLFAANVRYTRILLPFMPAKEDETGCPMVDPGDMRNQGTILIPTDETATPDN